MAPRKATNKNNKKKATATSKAKTNAKKKEAATVNPLEQKLRKVDASTIAILGERRDNTKRISSESHDYDLPSRIPKLIKAYPGHNVSIFGGSPELSFDAKSSKPNLIVVLVPHDKLPPPFVAYSANNECVIRPLDHHRLRWTKVAPSVYVLKSAQRFTQASIRALSEDSLAMEEHLQLFTIKPKEKLQRKDNGQLDVRDVNYTIDSSMGDEPITGRYEKGMGLQNHIEMLVDEYGAELGDDPEQTVKDAIKEAFNNARDVLEEQAAMLRNSGYSEELLDSMVTIKVYPKGTSENEKDSYINSYYNRADKVL